MNIAGGYELITGIFLGSWLIISAAGASIATKSPLTDLRKINLVFALSPILSFFILILFSRLILNSGETPSFLISLIYTFLVLLPYCIISGFTFVKLITIAKKSNNFTPGKSFSLETSGGIIAGIMVTVLTSGFLNTYQIVLLIILLTATYSVNVFYLKRIRLKLWLKSIVLILAAIIITFNPDILFRQALLPGIRVKWTKDTPYGNITTGIYKGEISTFYNQRLLSYSEDVVQREEDIHYAMLQAKSPEKVLLISGSLRSSLQEILKYPVKKITYIEVDPVLAEIEKERTDYLPDILTIKTTDAFKYIRDVPEKADVILLLIPPPLTFLLNKYYTTEFFSSVKKVLNHDGVFVCSPGPGDTYFNKESLKLYSAVYNSLSIKFQ